MKKCFGCFDTNRSDEGRSSRRDAQPAQPAQQGVRREGGPSVEPATGQLVRLSLAESGRHSTAQQGTQGRTRFTGDSARHQAEEGMRGSLLYFGGSAGQQQGQDTLAPNFPIGQQVQEAGQLVRQSSGQSSLYASVASDGSDEDPAGQRTGLAEAVQRAGGPSSRQERCDSTSTGSMTAQPSNTQNLAFSRSSGSLTSQQGGSPLRRERGQPSTSPGSSIRGRSGTPRVPPGMQHSISQGSLGSQQSTSPFAMGQSPSTDSPLGRRSGDSPGGSRTVAAGNSPTTRRSGGSRKGLVKSASNVSLGDSINSWSDVHPSAEDLEYLLSDDNRYRGRPRVDSRDKLKFMAGTGVNLGQYKSRSASGSLAGSGTQGSAGMATGRSGRAGPAGGSPTARAAAAAVAAASGSPSARRSAGQRSSGRSGREGRGEASGSSQGTSRAGFSGIGIGADLESPRADSAREGADSQGPSTPRR